MNSIEIAFLNARMKTSENKELSNKLSENGNKFIELWLKKFGKKAERDLDTDWNIEFELIKCAESLTDSEKKIIESYPGIDVAYSSSAGYDEHIDRPLSFFRRIDSLKRNKWSDNWEQCPHLMAFFLFYLSKYLLFSGISRTSEQVARRWTQIPQEIRDALLQDKSLNEEEEGYLSRLLYHVSLLS